MTSSGRVGLDIERLDRRPPVTRLASRWFATEELARLRQLQEDAARVAFLRLWTAKEASCKATGTGIFGYLPLWRFDVDAELPVLRQAPEDAGGERWRFWRLAPSSAHTAVIALRDGADALRISAFQLDS